MQLNKLALRKLGLDFFELYWDKEFFKRLSQIAFPIALQNFIMSSLNMVGVIMIGQLGEVSVAAVGLAGQIFFLLTLLLFGINSGAAMFTAQLWGKRDIANIRKVLSLSMIISLAGSVIFLIIAVLFPETALGIYSKDTAVVALGSSYLRIYGWSFIFIAITFSFAFVLRSIGDVKTPLVVSISALGINTLLAYVLIFGKLGLPALGVTGAALAALSARVVECCALLTVTYIRKSPVAVRLRDLNNLTLAFAGKVIRPIVPVALNELFWSLGITTYSIVYARIGTDSIAAMNIVGTIDNLALVIFIGIANACAILVGNWIGANDERQAFRYAARTLGIGIAGAILMGGLILIGSEHLLAFYKVSPLVIEHSRKILTILAFFLWLRVTNLILFVGIFRSGGDTRFAFFLDAGTIWVVGVPLALIAAFVLHLPVYWVYLFVMADEFAKSVAGVFRFFSKRWIHNLTQSV